jgi:hypothetical protein
MAKVLAVQWEVESRLASMGLTAIILHNAIRAGELERISCTSLDPRSYPGVAAWALTVRRLREQLKPEGWIAEDKNNLPLVIEPVRHIAIAVTSGNPDTGERAGEPTTKHPKGPMIAGQVEINQQQFSLFFRDAPRLVPIPRAEELLTWLLLVYATFQPHNESEGTHIAKCELSLPAAIDEAGYVCRWEERILLEPVRLDDVPRPGHAGEDEEDTGYDVPVTRR